MDKLIIYDTSDFETFPIGGQLTSVGNFLRFLSVEHSDFVPKVLLVGITTIKSELGKIKDIQIGNSSFKFLPVVYRSSDLSNVQSSLRLEFVNGLFKFRKSIPVTKFTVNYIHTPEAFIFIRTCHPSAKVAVFSHGSFFNMTKGFRFHKKKIIFALFDCFIKLLLKKADVIFTLDEDSYSAYIKYNSNVYPVENSVVLNDENLLRQLHTPCRLLFVGRLSKVKRIDTIIEALSQVSDVTLSIVGDGEEGASLHAYAEDLGVTDRVNWYGAVSPSEVNLIMKEHDILVMNSSIEGKPMTIIEGLKEGLPIITTDVGGIADMVDCNCAYFTNGSACSINDGIQTILSDYCTFSECAYENAKKYDYLNVNECIYMELIKLS